jgi:nucleotide-binding universal stress UspA family protein
MTTKQLHIVVGIDGSEASKAALRWAVDEARARDARVTVVHAWRVPVEYGMYEGMSVPESTVEEIEKAAEQTARETVADVLGSDTSVPVTTDVRCGPPSRELVEAAADADLLVVGSEGHGAFAGMLLGSVSLHVLHHAPCAVTVVRPGWTPAPR